jgi:hypothetical protein
VNAKSGMKTMKKIEPVGEIKDIKVISEWYANPKWGGKNWLEFFPGKRVNPEVVEELKKKSIECGYGIEAESRYGRGINNEKRST